MLSQAKQEPEKVVRTVEERIGNTYTDELILGFCSPIGSLKSEIVGSFISILQDRYKYKVIRIRLSDFIGEHYQEPYNDLPGETQGYSKLMYKIRGGNELRTTYKSSSILAQLAINKIRLERNAIKVEDVVGQRNCYIIDSIKNLDELKLFRTVYRELFYLIGVFSPLKERISNLMRDEEISATEAKKLINTDEYENNKFGQNVRNIFVKSDFFIRVSSENMTKLTNNIERYLHLIFNSGIVTPNQHETAMFFAKAAACNSSCLSRQVGATITNTIGVPIARGWNDVAKYGGGLYCDGDSTPLRCKERGTCANTMRKNTILLSIQEKLVNKGISNPSEVMEIVGASEFGDVIEYSRSIHAEMHAIISGSQLTGEKMKGGNLYCTTYPCHNCARHIVVSGIKNVYYIEPYEKSLSLVLHDDSITEDESDTSKVRLMVYDGVSPNRYLELFGMDGDDRKDGEGNLKNVDYSTVKPKLRLSLQAIPRLEEQAMITLREHGLL